MLAEFAKYSAFSDCSKYAIVNGFFIVDLVQAFLPVNKFSADLQILNIVCGGNRFNHVIITVKHFMSDKFAINDNENF